MNTRHGRWCWAHVRCLCGFTAEEAHADLRSLGSIWQLCWQKSIESCVCTFTEEEAMRMLYPAAHISSFSIPRLLHMAMSFGLRGRTEESTRSLYDRACLFLTCVQLLRVWHPRAVEAATSNVEWDDLSFERIRLFACGQTWPRNAAESSHKFLERVRCETNAVKERLQ